MTIKKEILKEFREEFPHLEDTDEFKDVPYYKDGEYINGIVSLQKERLGKESIEKLLSDAIDRVEKSWAESVMKDEIKKGLRGNGTTESNKDYSALDCHGVELGENSKGHHDFKKD